MDQVENYGQAVIPVRIVDPEGDANTENIDEGRDELMMKMGSWSCWWI